MITRGWTKREAWLDSYLAHSDLLQMVQAKNSDVSFKFNPRQNGESATGGLCLPLSRGMLLISFSFELCNLAVFRTKVVGLIL